MPKLATTAAFLSLLFSGAIFGFFYAWVCSTMWGLDTLDPRIAIAAMQAMNGSVANGVFAPAFFGTPVVLLVAAILAWCTGTGRAAAVFAAGALLYVVGGYYLTITVHVPMNRALGELPAITDMTEAQAIWQAYSPQWQVWNITRTLVCGVVLMLAGIGTWILARQTGR